MRIAVGGFQHETNTFAPVKATLADFEAADAWPGLVSGGDLLDAVGGINLPITGFIDAARTSRHEIVPLLWCSATPSAQVTREAFEHIAAKLLEGLRAAGSVDAVFLDLHGAMVAEHIDDADGELLRRVRQLVGDDIPLVASLDFHANVSDLMIEQATALCSYRTYPHVDMAETGARTFRILQALRGRKLVHAVSRLPFLIPLTSQCTLIEPFAMLMAATARAEGESILACNFTPGFPAADVFDCGPSVFAYGRDQDAVGKTVNELSSRIAECEKEFALKIYSIEQTLREIDTATHNRGRPIILADTQDNPGGGGNADTTSLLKALASHRVPSVLAGVMFDPSAATRAHAAGVDATIELSLGAQTRFAGESPMTGSFKVLALGDGRFTGTGPYYKGARMALGPMALLRIGELTIAIASKKQQAADQAMFHHLGIEPREFAVLALKSSVHFRADFGPIASRVLVVDAPGPNIADPEQLPFTKLRPEVHTRPATKKNFVSPVARSP
jgi:microcystin degradation protein MlrC